MADKINKGKILIETDKGIFPYSLLQKAHVIRSKQLKQQEKWMAGNGLVSPPFTPDSFLTLYESNATFYGIVDQLGSDVAGNGWGIQLREGAKENEVEFKKAMFLFNQPNEDESLRTLFKTLIIDWGVIGWFGLEVVRDVKKEVSRLYRVPAQTLRVHESKLKYVQQRTQKKVWFKKFGIDGDISAKDGKEKSRLNIRTRANELIWYMNPYPRSDYYGVPKALSATGDIVGLIGVRDYNLAFFENYGIPSAIIVLEGEWETGSDKRVKDFINKEIKGTDNAHKTLVVTQPEGCKFKYEPLRTEVKDGSFKLYRTDLKENLLVAYSMPPERVGIRVVGQMGGNVAAEATKIYVGGVVEPLQNDLEDIITEKIMRMGLGIENYTFRFKKIDLRDEDALVKRLNSMVERGIISPNEARAELGKKPYDGGNRIWTPSTWVEQGELEEDA